MKLKLILTLTLAYVVVSTYGQKDFNLEVISNISIDERVNDVWGYVGNSGLEYAIVGSLTRTSIWSLEDPASPILRGTFDGPSSIWRDIKSFDDHLYVVADQGSVGILVLDMSLAPETITPSIFQPEISIDNQLDTLNRVHNLFVDKGICYVAGSNIGEGGVLMYDLNIDKKNPPLVGIENFDYAHDVFVKSDKMYTSNINSGVFRIYDISDKMQPILLGEESTVMNFTHNAWLSDDENFLFTTDERKNAWIESYDVSDPNNITFLDRFQPFETKDTDVIPHNVHYHHGFLVTSWNTDGLVIMDAHNPDNLVKVAAYDTEKEITSGSGGLWGAYPYLPSGLILGSDRWNGLFIWQVTTNQGNEGYQRASYISGTITDAMDGSAIPNVEITILTDENVEATTNVSGKYKTGHALDIMVDVRFKKDGYEPQVQSIQLIEGETVNLDISLMTTVNTMDVSDTNFSLSPNPVKDLITINENIDATIVIYDINGIEYIRKEIIGNTIDVSSLESGVYLLYVASDIGNLVINKFIKI